MMTERQKTSKRFIFALGVASVLSCASAVAHGWLDGRWANQPDLILQGGQLQSLPPVIGDWTLVEDRQLPNSAAKMLRCYGYNHSVYQNTRSGKNIVLAVLFGPRGPIAVHTPEICYSGQGVQAAGPRRKVVIESAEPQSLWKVSFLSKVDLQPELDVYYGWTADGRWQAAEQPRFWLTDDLYKIQIAGPPAIEGQPPECEEFLKQLLAILEPLLAPQ